MTATPNGAGSAGRDRLPVPRPPDPAFLSLASRERLHLPPGELYFLPGRKPKAVELEAPGRKVAEVIRAAGDTAPGRAELLEAVKSVSSDPRSVEKVIDGLAEPGRSSA